MTRWEGATSLYEGPGLLVSIQKTSEYLKHVTADQMARMLNTFFRAEYLDHGELTLMALFRKQAGPELVRFLIQYLRRAGNVIPPTSEVMGAQVDSLPHPWNVFDAMRELGDLLDSTRAREITAKYLRTSFFDVNARVEALQIFLPVIEEAATQQGYLPPRATGQK